MTTAPKLKPVPVRLDGRESDLVSRIAKATGLNKSEILRRACRFALPRFLSGKINIARVVAEDAA